MKKQEFIFLKRFIDVVGAFFGLVVLFPLFLLISCLIKLDSSGSVIFKQKRLGKKGKEFEMLKFRTMVINAERVLENNPKLLKIYKKNSYKIKNDPRWTSGGKFLRKYSLDELPQLINILKGEMSLVGPRAYRKEEMVDQLKVYPELKRYAKQSLSVKPGLTGIWQTSGRSELGFKQRVMLDCSYSKKQSIILDLRLIIKTIPVVINSTGAW